MVFLTLPGDGTLNPIAISSEQPASHPALRAPLIFDVVASSTAGKQLAAIAEASKSKDRVSQRDVSVWARVASVACSRVEINLTSSRRTRGRHA
ncbi:MAG: hypothetical protein JWP44_4970 [Mucilaginibacter sp.]|jgi:hypothetical protein|nr:hypothetical protein [Mucilaginibacter sp.]